uniref:Uncharacterized protein n=1 Tax=Arion vulgaris TaxID=1028688 RepID=A0A0B7BCN6_9EUPU
MELSCGSLMCQRGQDKDRCIGFRVKKWCSDLCKVIDVGHMSVDLSSSVSHDPSLLTNSLFAVLDLFFCMESCEWLFLC